MKIPIFVLLIASFVTMLDLIMQPFFYDMYLIFVIFAPLIVTPDLHRVHHSVHPDEHLQMQIGLDYFRAPEEANLLRMMTQPMRPPEPR